MSAILGTFVIFFADESEGTFYPAAALTDASLDIKTAMLAAANPDNYGWDYSVPGNQSWGGSASNMQVLGGAESRPEGQVQLDRLAHDKKLLRIVFQNRYGGEYRGFAYVESWSVGGAFGGVMAGQYQLRGVGALDYTEAGSCGTVANSGGEGVTEATYYLGENPGTVTLTYEAFTAMDTFEMIYDGEVVATTGGPVAGSGSISFVYAAQLGYPRSVTVRVTGESSGTAWEYTIGCPS